MVSSIMIPVDLAHVDTLQEAIDVAVKLAKADNASMTIIGVTESVLTQVAKAPEEYTSKLEKFAADLSDKNNLPVAAKSIVDVDVPADLGGVLVGTAEEIGADLIVMASHIPRILEYLFSSNAGFVALHAKCSVYIVR